MGTCSSGITILDHRTLVAEGYSLGAYISSNSWGFNEEIPLFGAYINHAQQYDAAVIDALPDVEGNQPTVVVFAAGNQRRDVIDIEIDGEEIPDYWDSINPPGTAKNVITVGASENDKPFLNHIPEKVPAESDNPNEIAIFSSLGPTDDGRIKPDVVAPGTWIVSAESSQVEPGCSILKDDEDSGTDSYYLYLSGTSTAAAHVSGAAALITEYYRNRYGFTPSPALIKALLINSAVDMGYGYGYRDDLVIGEDNLPPGYGYNVQGWGRINVANSLFSTSNRAIWFDDEQQHSSYNGGSLELNSAGQTLEYVVHVDGAEPLKVSLVWSDPSRTPSAAGRALVNDLDLTVKSPLGLTYYGNYFGTDSSNHYSAIGGFPSDADRVNNVENVFVENPGVGRWKIRITANKIDASVSKSQRFALVISGHGIPVDNFEYLDPPDEHDWWEYDHPGQGTFFVEWNPIRNSNVLRTTTTLPPGQQRDYGIALTGVTGIWLADLGIRGKFFSLWFKDDNDFYIFVRVRGICSSGEQLFVLTYDADQGLPSIGGGYLHHHLGPKYKDGNWHLIERDFSQDLQPLTNCKLKGVLAFYFRGDFYVDDLDVRDLTMLMAAPIPTRGWGVNWGPFMNSQNLELTDHIIHARPVFGIGTTVSVRFAIRNPGNPVTLLYVYVETRPDGEFRDFYYPGPITLNNGESMTFVLTRTIDLDAIWTFTPGYSRGSCVWCPDQYWKVWRNAAISVNTLDWDKDTYSNNNEWVSPTLPWQRLDPWSRDTDADSVEDKLDLEPSANLFMLMALTWVSIQDDTDGGGKSDTYWVLFLDWTWVSTQVRWDFICVADGPKPLRIYYTLDIPDNINTVVAIIEAWDDNLPADIQFDISPVVGVRSNYQTHTIPGVSYTDMSSAGSEWPRQSLWATLFDNSDGLTILYRFNKFDTSNIHEAIFAFK